MKNGVPRKRDTVVLLRWVLIIALPHLLLLDGTVRQVPARLAPLIAVALASNLLRAQVNVRRFSSVVANLLQAACIEAGRVRFQLAPVQLNDVVEDVFTLEAGAAVL